MIKGLIQGAAEADDWLDRRLGRPYAAILVIGLVAEIGRRIVELFEHRLDQMRLVQVAWLLALNAALLIHQLASLHHIRERRLSRGAGHAPSGEAASAHGAVTDGEKGGA
jgi:hypothetical protein